MFIRKLLTGAFALAALWTATPAGAQTQTPARGKLIVTVADPSGAIIPGATVTMTGQEDATRAVVVSPAVTTTGGIATIADIPVGRYVLQAEFPGFETAIVRDVRVRSGENRRAVTLPIKKVAEDVTVGRDKQASGLDPQGAAFSTVLTREQIKALPDDPDEMEQVLKAMSPPGAVLRVDGFTGAKLPPKSQIRSIRLPRMDQLAAQNHGSLNGMMHIDVMSQPGLGPLRGSTDFTLRDDALNARNPFTPVKGDEGLRQYGGSLSGSLVPGKTSFSINAQGAQQHDTTNLLAALPGGVTDAQAIRRPTDRMNLYARLDTSINKDHALGINFQRSSSTSQNLGVGNYNLPETGFSQRISDNVFRVSENGPLGRRFFSESRFQAHWNDTDAQASLEAPTVRVLDAFTAGGAQQSGGNHTLEFEAASDLDYVRGKHSMRAGLLFEGGRYHSNDTSNYLGTFTFANLDDYLAGRPTTYTRRLGNPDLRFTNVQAGAYAQDDFRLARSLLVSYGVRYEAQTLIPDQNNISPRVSLSWSPLKSGKTTLRGGWGTFTDWFGTATYKQTQLIDGVREREINILDPAYPDPELIAGAAVPTNRYLLGAGVRLPEVRTANFGVDQVVTSSFRLNATYTFRAGSNLQRGRNLNVPVAGVRPDPAFSNIVEVESDAASRTHSLNLSGVLIALNWHRTIFSMNYSFTGTRNNTAGAFSLPATGDDLAAEWGQTTPTHRFGGSLTMQVVQDVGISINARAQSGTPYNVTTGIDANGDGVFNDRPAGVGRNSALTPSQWDLGVRVSYAVGFGKKPPQSGGGGSMIVMVGPGGGMPGGFGGGADSKRYRVEFYVSAQNVTNHTNFVGYSGVMTSPFFGQPTNVLNPRKAEIGVRFGF